MSMTAFRKPPNGEDSMLKLNTVLLLSAALLSFVLSVGLWFTGHQDQGSFMGIWVPSILAFGIYVNSLQPSRS